MTATTLTLIRNTSFSLLGLILLGYALAVLITGRPDPVSPIVPGAAGILTGIVVTLTARMATGKAAGITWDELTRATWRQALIGGYWVAVWLYALFGLGLYLDLVSPEQSFAAMGTLTGAAPFLMFLTAWVRGRV